MATRGRSAPLESWQPYPVRVWVGVKVAVEKRLQWRGWGHRLSEAILSGLAVLQGPVPHRGERRVRWIRGRIGVKQVSPAVDGCVGLTKILRALASLPLAVGQEAGEEWQVNAVMQGQQEVVCQLEARGVLGQQLPNTVQEEQEDWSLLLIVVSVIVDAAVEAVPGHDPLLLHQTLETGLGPAVGVTHHLHQAGDHATHVPVICLLQCYSQVTAA